MEAATVRDLELGVSVARLVREPLLWAGVAAVVGAVVGLVGTFYFAAWFGDPSGAAPYPRRAWLAAPSGKLLTVLSVLGILALVDGRSRPALRVSRIVGVALVAVFLVAFLTVMARQFGWISPGIDTASLIDVLFFADLALPGVIALPFALVALLGRELRVGVALIFLCAFGIPFLLVWQVLSGGIFGEVPENVTAVVLLGGIGVGVSLPAAPLWVLLGLVFLRRARSHASGEAFRVQEKENLDAARRLYEEGLGRGDGSVMDELVSEDFRDLRRGSRGKLAMERVFAALWKSYPDLSVEVEEQAAEGDLVTTRLVLSGTDRGGVMWYPPTGRSVTFSAEFVDRFSEGELVEHSGETDTEGLLEQLGLGDGR